MCGSFEGCCEECLIAFSLEALAAQIFPRISAPVVLTEPRGENTTGMSVCDVSHRLPYFVCFCLLASGDCAGHMG
jgi:hypothetical protein